jgi:hypothetical protein
MLPPQNCHIYFLRHFFGVTNLEVMPQGNSILRRADRPSAKTHSLIQEEDQSIKYSKAPHTEIFLPRELFPCPQKDFLLSIN